MKKLFILVTLIIIFLSSCNSNNPHVTSKNNPIDTSFFKNINEYWYFRNYKTDSVPGINLIDAYRKIIKNKKGKEIVVAIIDTDINISHEELKDFIWSNPKEIVGNNIDDDDNGYVDDIHGWNFVRNKEGKRIIYGNYSDATFIKKYDSLFKSTSNVTDTLLYKKYLQAKKDLKKTITTVKANAEYGRNLNKEYLPSKKSMDSLFNNIPYTVKQLDSVYYVYEVTNPALAIKSDYMSRYIGENLEGLGDLLIKDYDEILNKSSNLKYNDRDILGDNPEDLSDRNYGNPKIDGDLDFLDHGTSVSGVLASNMTNNKGILGITNNVKLMILSTAPRKGINTDKDLALAIYYAVDNGAKIINYSSNRELAFNYDFVEDALKYAESKGVLFVKAAGNGSKNIDVVNSYPNKYYNGTLLNNFICVSATDYFLNETLKPTWANYGKQNVDLFAPGYLIKTTKSTGGYKRDTGSSMATPMVAGTASLIMSYYPELSTEKVKEIILNTVDTYDVDVLIDETSGEMKRFSELSRSGGILNAYKALKLADSISTLK